MPLYQYRCRECGFDLEARQKFSDDPLQECPNCGAAQGLQRVIQSAGIVFKGSGFYINDSKGSKREVTAPAKKSEESATPAASSTGDSSATESKPSAAPASSESKTSATPSTPTPSAAS